MFQGNVRFVAVVLLLAGCGRAGGASVAEPAAAEASYVAPPSVAEAHHEAGGVILQGVAAPGAQVRLATPAGEAFATRADGDGRWRLQAPADGQARIFGLSAVSGGRRVQAQGYLLVGPRGETALLRAGAGALRMDRAPGARLAAVDFDSQGGAVASGWAPAGTDVSFRLDGRTLGESRADPDGRFSFPLPRLSAGAHSLEASGVGFADQTAIDAGPVASLGGTAMQVRLAGRGLRADWLTPGGGVQSTLLVGG